MLGNLDSFGCDFFAVATFKRIDAIDEFDPNPLDASRTWISFDVAVIFGLAHGLYQ